MLDFCPTHEFQHRKPEKLFQGDRNNGALARGTGPAPEFDIDEAISALDLRCG